MAGGICLFCDSGSHGHAISPGDDRMVTLGSKPAKRTTCPFAPYVFWLGGSAAPLHFVKQNSSRYRYFRYARTMDALLPMGMPAVWNGNISLFPHLRLSLSKYRLSIIAIVCDIVRIGDDNMVCFYVELFVSKKEIKKLSSQCMV